LTTLAESLIGGLFAMVRTVYAMAADGLQFRFLAKVHPRSQVPLITIAIFGTFTALIAFLIDVDILVNLLAIGIL
jgi:amino acid transporter